MTSPSEITPGPGQVAYEEWQRRFDGCVVEDWHRDLADSERSDWSGVASAVLAAAAPEVAEDDPATRLLALPLDESGCGASSARQYLAALSVEVWRHEKRAGSGDSDWRYDLYEPMVRAGLVHGTFDADGYMDTFPDKSRAEADKLILAAIERMGQS